MKSPSKSIHRAFAVSVIIATLTGACYIALVKVPAVIAGNVTNGTLNAAKRIAEDIDSLIHARPQIICGGITLAEASNSITELTTVEKPFEHTYSYESTWLGSTKRIKVKGQFMAKAGYDLTKPFTIDVSEDMRTLRAQMPPAQINSVEQLSIEILQEDAGWWNKISTEDRQSALNALLLDAKMGIRKSTILADTDKAFREQFEKILRSNAPPEVAVEMPPLL